MPPGTAVSVRDRGELLAFLDSDDVWMPGKLRAQIDNVPSDAVLSFEGVQWFVDREEDAPLLRQTETVKWPRCNSSGYITDPVLDVAEGRYLHLGTLLCKKSAFLKVGMFDEKLCMGEDEDWFSRASLKTAFHYLPEPFLSRRLHANQTGSESEESLRSLISVFENIKARTEHIHPEAHAIANRRLADKWSHLATRLSRKGRHREAVRAARNAYALEPGERKAASETGPGSLAMRPVRGCMKGRSGVSPFPSRERGPPRLSKLRRLSTPRLFRQHPRPSRTVSGPLKRQPSELCCARSVRVRRNENGAQRLCDPVQILLRHLREERQENGSRLGPRRWRGAAPSTRQRTGPRHECS